MSAFALYVFENFALPWLVSVLVKEGVFSYVQGTAIKGLNDFIIAIKGLKTYSDPQKDFPADGTKNGSL